MKSLYSPRHFFSPFHARKHRWYYLVAHRRAGKTVSAVNDILEKATYNTREAPRYGYIGPLLKQSKQIAWDYLKKFSAPYRPKVNESELYVELQAMDNSPRISIYGADNPDAFRGLYFDGVVLDEFGNMRGSVFDEILLPALIDRRGWAVFMGTPNGPNHFRDAWYAADKQPELYGKLFLPASVTKIIPQDDLDMMKRMMDREQYLQEMECSFEASVRGAVYARQMEAMTEAGRIGHFPLQKGVKTNVTLDLGFRDSTALGFWQVRPDGIVIGRSHSDNLKPIKTYTDYIADFFKSTGHVPGELWLPHDAKAKSLQTGKSIIQLVHKELKHVMGRPKIVPDMDLIDGIAATRVTFPLFYINQEECQDLILAAKSYHYKYDEETKKYSDEPVHDWSSHYMDMTRYLAICANPNAAMTLKQAAEQDPSKPITVPQASGLHYAFALNNIWDLGPRHSGRL